jgi:predicted dehydrogenase
MERKQAAQPLRVGIIGAGGIARFHAQALRKLPGVMLEAVCDRDRNRAVTLQQSFSIPQVFDSVAEMSQRAAIDVVHVLLPPAAHAAMAIDAVERGWHVFVEKPFVTTAQACANVAAAAKRAGRHVGVNHNLTFLPAFLRLLDDIRARRLGYIESVHACFNMPMPQLATGQHGHWMFAETGNIVFEIGPHPLSAIVRLMGPVAAANTVVSGQRTLKNGKAFFDGWYSVLSCQRGTAQCSFSFGGDFADGWIYVTGQDGCAMVDLLRNTYFVSRKSRFVKPVEDFSDAVQRSSSIFSQGLRNISNFAAGMLGFSVTNDAFSVGMRNSIAAFYEALGQGIEPPAGMIEAASVVDACEAIVESVHVGEPRHARS